MSTRYHRLARETPAYAWWKLPVAGLLAVPIYFGAIMLLLVVALIVFAAGPGVDQLDAWIDASGDLDLQHLDFFALDMLGLALMIPAVLVAVLDHRAAPDRLPLIRRRPAALALAGPHRRDGVRGVRRDDRRLGRAGRGDGSVGGQLTRRQHAGAASRSGWSCC